ncbi:MAG: bifunctional histidinol-phosphatase/imidazoleglycerol-phosphate dehydratase HisB [Saprospiraceae bacterium]|nr:bifunctional histidinol-phosphatase/imidazoleglycerol-phosphate dehydratase HisB [Saprospiraceae bacterium]
MEPPDNFQVDSLEKLEFYPEVFQYLSRIAQMLDYELVLVTNQDGLGTPAFPETSFWPAHNKMLRAFEKEGVRFSEVLIDRSFPHENAPTRKPGTGMLTHYLRGGYDVKNSFVIGDRHTDVELAGNLGCGAIFLGPSPAKGAALCTTRWADIWAFLSAQPRTATVRRQTAETDIAIRLNLDGAGRSAIDTGLGFFNHLLEQIARHGQIDLDVQVRGDLHVDEHHSIEDTALALGEAFHQALGSKKGIERYGFLLPMDDCLAQVAIDFGGRPWLVWEASFHREKIGEMPTEMFPHFFKSFSDAARCNLHIRAEGTNEHHKIEAIFKAFARAVRMAIGKTGSTNIPSTKGIL